MDDHRIAYITFSNKNDAREMGKKLVEERLAACVNIIDGMESMYWWEGAVESESEVIMLAKTTSEYIEKLTDYVVKWHPYDCPCVISFSPKSDEGNPAYLKWLIDETGPELAD